MQITSDKNEMIFKGEYKGKPIYSLSLRRKKPNGDYENGYIVARFRNGVELENKTYIKIKEAWLSFFRKDNKETVVYIFINDFEKVAPEKKGDPDPFKEFGESIKTEVQEQVEINEDDYPF